MQYNKQIFLGELVHTFLFRHGLRCATFPKGEGFGFSAYKNLYFIITLP